MIPKKYDWIRKEPGPKMILEAMKLYGTKEIVGVKHNQVILDWAAEVGLQNVYKADEIPWCGLAMAVVAKRAGKEIPKDPLWALNWAKFGIESHSPMFGDILTFKRPGGGHVGLYVAESINTYHVLGGNQGNAFNITEIAKFRLYKARRPIYSIGQPPNVSKRFVNASGVISTNEG